MAEQRTLGGLGKVHRLNGLHAEDKQLTTQVILIIAFL